jgi:hypothetical protein
MSIPLSILDLAPIAPGQTARESFEGSVALAQAAERAGYRRVWYAEHHNMASIASSATSVLIGYVAAHTSSIRLGSGGVDRGQPLAVFGPVQPAVGDRLVQYRRRPVTVEIGDPQFQFSHDASL